MRSSKRLEGLILLNNPEITTLYQLTFPSGLQPIRSKTTPRFKPEVSATDTGVSTTVRMVPLSSTGNRYRNLVPAVQIRWRSSMAMLSHSRTTTVTPAVRFALSTTKIICLWPTERWTLWRTRINAEIESNRIASPADGQSMKKIWIQIQLWTGVGQTH